MFKKRTDNEIETLQAHEVVTDVTPTANQENITILNSDTRFKGSLSFERTLKIDGEFEGDITTSGTLLVGKEATIKAEIKARNAIVEGSITGNVTVEEKLYLHSNAKLIGDIQTGRIKVEEGAIVVGHCQVKAKEDRKQTEEQEFNIPIEMNSGIMS